MSAGKRAFADREDAGHQLATALASELTGRADDSGGTLVLGLPRGGLVVAAVVAADLGLPVDALVVRKVGAPGNPELAMGAVTADGTLVVNDQVVRAEELTSHEVAALVQVAAQAAVADALRYRGDRPGPHVAGREVAVVDDGAATGATVRAAVASVRAAGARRVVVGLPVAPRETLAVLEHEADAVVCVRRPLLFRAVGWAYADFDPTPDDEVRALLTPQPPGRVPRGGGRAG